MIRAERNGGRDGRIGPDEGATEAGGRRIGGNGEGAKDEDGKTDGKAEYLNESPHTLTRMERRQVIHWNFREGSTLTCVCLPVCLCHTSCLLFLALAMVHVPSCTAFD